MMKCRRKPTVLPVLMMAVVSCAGLRFTSGQEPERQGPWLTERSAEGRFTMTAEMVLRSAAEPQPALKHRLIPDAYDQVAGNSAIYYLKAMGFLEQTAAAKMIFEFREKNRKVADERGLTNDNVPPDSWLDMAPSQLPLAEVKEYLRYTAFQTPLLAEATLRTEFELDRNIRDVESPIAYLLPEIQTMRELARVQSLRCRVAIAEQRVGDAIEILHQQFTMARHLGTDEFLVSNLVGAAILAIALQDAIYVVQEPEAPNLYWAFATLPTPMIDMNRALALERQFLVLQIKALQEVDETPRSAGYWQDYIDRVLPQIRGLDLYESGWLGRDPQLERTTFVSLIAAAYPGAKRFLTDQCHMDQAKVDAYPTAQVVFLAMKRFNEHMVDDHFKWIGLPYDQMMQHPEFKRRSEVRSSLSQQVGWVSVPTNQMLSAVDSIRGAQVRVQQQMGLFQTIEAIRMYGAANAGKLPPSLGDLPYPAPNDPVSGKPFQYQVQGEQATLVGDALPFIQYRFRLRMAK